MQGGDPHLVFAGHRQALDLLDVHLIIVVRVGGNPVLEEQDIVKRE